MKIAEEADAKGLPVGRPAHEREIRGAGESNYLRDYRAQGMAPPKTGLDAYDNRHSSMGNPTGVGGYDFRQAKDRVPPQVVDEAAPAAEGELLPPPKLAPVVQKPDLQRDGFHRAWQMAKTQDEKDAIVERAHDEGLQMNEAAIPSLERRGRLNGRIAQSNGEWAGGNFYGEGKMIPGSANPETLEKVVPRGGLQVVDEKDLAYQRAIHSRTATEGRYRMTGDARPYTERTRGTATLTPTEIPKVEYMGVGPGGLTQAQVDRLRLERRRKGLI
jgi:hypothetical protein